MNKDLGKTQITNKIIISSAAIFYPAPFENYWQYETWCFSDDPNQKSFQSIHGTSIKESEKLELKTRKIHKYISLNIQRINEEIPHHSTELRA